MLPIDTLLLTASADSVDPRTGQSVEQPVLSVVIPRASLEILDFDLLDPSDAIENFLHRGNFKASRKTETFAPITPLTPADIPRPTSHYAADIHDLISTVKQLREELKTECTRLNPHNSAPGS
jgi:hypothetical protein